MKIRTVTDEKIGEFRRWVEEDFPGDAMLQEVHLARLILQEKMRDMTNEEQTAYLNRHRGKSDAA